MFMNITAVFINFMFVRKKIIKYQLQKQFKGGNLAFKDPELMPPQNEMHELCIFKSTRRMHM